MKNRIALVVFYFGAFPDYFPFFLRSCAVNPEYHWHIFTDNPSTSFWPANVYHHPMTLREAKDFFQRKFDFPVSLSSPKKLCDYKPLYGFLLEEELRGYDFWGHCDLDQIFGQMMIPDDFFQKYDKLYTLGHFSLYRNTPEVNCMLLERKQNRVREVLQTEKMMAFDEWGPENTNEAFQHSGLKFYAKEYGADIWPVSKVFQLSRYQAADNRYRPVAGTRGILRWRDGRLFYIYQDGREEEFPYVHLQKRTLPVSCPWDQNDFYITPDGFLPNTLEKSEILKKSLRKPLVDLQYLKVRSGNLKRRLSHR